MAHPARSRNHAALLLSASIIALLAALALPDAGKGFTLQAVLLMGGLTGTAFGAVWLLVRWDEAKRFARLKAGEGVIARCTVDPVRWEWFRQQSNEWDKRDGIRPNNADLGQTAGASGIEIVVTGDCILIGDDFHPLEKDVAIQSQPGWMEFDQTIDNQNGPHWHKVLRIPLAPDDQQQAAQIVEIYSQAYAVAAASPRFKIYALLIIFVGLPALTGLIVWLVHLLKRAD